uniref:Uncharacterized protein n=1 Tax=Arundo donax TaxID=35708 RepID=A0A0A9GGL8_ARUDO
MSAPRRRRRPRPRR